MYSERKEIKRLEKELQSRKEQLKQKERNCAHEWDNVVYDPVEYQKPVFSHYVPHGSDPEPVYNYVTKTRDRWSRVCKKCGKKEYAYNQKAVKYEPDFL